MPKKTEWIETSYDALKTGDEIKTVTEWEDGETSVGISEVVGLNQWNDNSVEIKGRGVVGSSRSLRRDVKPGDSGIMPLRRTIYRRETVTTYRAEGLTKQEVEWLKGRKFAYSTAANIVDKIVEE